MAKYVAFLRGINVGGRMVKMSDLKKTFASLGFNSIVTVLQTGNVIFETDLDLSKLKPIIEKKLEDNFNYPLKIQVFSFEKLKTIIAGNPFMSDVNRHRYVIFLENNLENQLFNEASEHDNNIESIRVGDGVIYWSVPIGLTLKSNFAKFLTKAPYKYLNTNRNINTLRKIIEK